MSTEIYSEKIKLSVLDFYSLKLKWKKKKKSIAPVGISGAKPNKRKKERHFIFSAFTDSEPTPQKNQLTELDDALRQSKLKIGAIFWVGEWP